MLRSYKSSFYKSSTIIRIQTTANSVYNNDNNSNLLFNAHAESILQQA